MYKFYKDINTIFYSPNWKIDKYISPVHKTGKLENIFKITPGVWNTYTVYITWLKNLYVEVWQVKILYLNVYVVSFSRILNSVEFPVPGCP